jgi:AcrR family transcriptional regulator
MTDAKGVPMAKPTGRSPDAGARPATSNSGAAQSATSNSGAAQSATSNSGADTESRAKRFMKSALAILGETGRTDFTVLEVVERSKTSLRSFYQHFSTKDELLLALIDKIMAESTQKWREETTGLASAAALRLLIDRICAPAESTTQDSINRGLTFYNDHLAETLPREYARVLLPLHELIQDILNRGMAEGTFRADLDVNATAALIMQTVLGAMRLRVLGVELNGVPIDANHIYEFCTRGLANDGEPV